MTNEYTTGAPIHADTFKIGAIVQVSVWCGIVQDVYTSAHTGEIVIKILFAKNVFKGQSAELHSARDLQGKMKPAPREQLAAEIELLQQGLARRLAALEAPTSNEVKP